MEANTYPDPRVSRYVNEFAIPVQFNVVEDPGATARYHSFWTPTVMLYDVDGNEYRRSYGMLTPERFLSEMSLGYALRFLHSGQFEKTLEKVEDALEYTRADPLRHAENYYWLGVAKYRATDDPDGLGEGWQELRSHYPDSDWARKTDFFFD